MPRHPRSAPHRSVRSARVAGLTAVILASLVLAGCAIAPPSPSTTPAATATSPEPDPSVDATPVEPTLVPDGTAGDNLPLFTAVTAAVWATEERAVGRAYIDALVAAGFDKAAMEVTNDQSTVGNAAESILFSVRWGQECLVGQVGPATGEPATIVVAALAEGTCLVGATRPIDW